MKQPVKKILLALKETAGDIIIATGLATAIKRKFPDANLYVATNRQYFNIFDGHPAVKKMLEFNDFMYDFRNYETFGPKKNAFDIVYVPTIVTQRIPHWLHSGHGIYLGHVYAHMCDLDTNEYGPQFIRLDKPNVILPEKYITVHAKTTQAPKNYSHMPEVVARIKDVSIVQIGGEDDPKLDNIALDLRGKTTWQETAYVLKNADLHLGLDSAPMHAAMYVETPSIILFGGTHASQGVDPKKSEFITAIEPEDRFLCINSCHLITCEMEKRHIGKCIDNIPVDLVLDKIASKLGEKHVKRQDPIRLSTYMILRNGIKYGFPFQQSIEAAAKLSDEVVVVDGGSSDGTLETLRLMKERIDNLRVFQHEWDVENNPTLFGDEKTHARKLCEGNYLLQLDADEIIHEPYPGALREKIRKHRDVDVLCMPVINFYGDDNTVRVEPVCWKWRVSKHNPKLVHTVHKQARHINENSQVVMDKRVSDGCEVCYSDTFELAKFKPVFDLSYEVLHQEVLKSEGQDEAKKQEYVEKLSEIVGKEPLVVHLSWHNLDRKLANGEFWDKETWHGIRGATHNTTQDIENRIKNKHKEILVRLPFSYLDIIDNKKNE